MKIWNFRILKERQSGNAGQNWFGRDGRLVCLPNPIQRKPTRPIVYEENPPAIETIYCPPNLPGPNGEPANTDQPWMAGLSNQQSGLTHCQLEIDVSSLVFEHHHLFSLEHYLSSRLTEVFDRYQQTLSKMKNLDLDHKLKVLYHAVDDLKEKLEICVQKNERDFQVSNIFDA